MEKVKNQSEYFLYEIAVLSLVPWIGILFGITSIIWGALKKNYKLSVIGFAGILTTVLCGVLYYYGIKRRPFWDMDFDSIWHAMYSHIINGWFWIMIVAAMLTFALNIITKIIHKKFFKLKGIFYGFLLWTIISIPINLEGSFQIFGLFSGEQGWGVIMLYMPSVIGFIIGGYTIGLFLERKLK